jgi:hypothetical protein
MTDERIFPYAVVDASLAPPADLDGLRGAPIEVIVDGALGAWASTLVSFEARRDDVLVHHQIVERASDRGRALPVRFGISFASREALADALRRRQSSLLVALTRVGRRRELAVSLEWRTPPAPKEAEPAHTPAPLGPGHRFLAQRARHWAGAEARRTRAEQLSAELRHALAAGGVVDSDVKERIVPAPRVALSCSVLADPSRAEELSKRVREVADGWDDVRLHLAGPWPPYSFSDTE